jgi:eukaryotic-like serine/threonine-protein kinase
VDAATGQAIWTYTTNNFVNGSVAIENGQIVFGGCDEFIRVLNAGGDSVAEIELPSNIPGTVALVQGRAFTGHYGNAFVCADLASQKVVWSYQPGRQPFFSSAAVLVEGNKVVFGGRDRRVHCVNRLTGKPLWTFRTGGDVDSSPVICGSKVVVGSNDGVLYVLNLADGKKLGSYEIGSPVASSPAVAAGQIVVGADDGYVYCFGAD